MTFEMATCPYCGRKLVAHGLTKHTSKCLHGPVGERVRAFMHDNAVDGVAMSSPRYRKSKERQALKLPADDTITDQMGSWETFVKWCGLSYAGMKVPHRYGGSYIRRVERNEPAPRVDVPLLNRQELADQIDRSLHSLKGCRVYAEPFRDMDTGQVYQRYVMELR